MLILLCGLPGSGKTTASLFFQQKGIPVVRMGMITEKILSDKNETCTEKNEKKVREMLRLRHGKAVYAKMIYPKIAEYDQVKHIIIEGLRSLQELRYFQKKYKTYTLFLDAKAEIRKRRLRRRKIRPLTYKEAEQREQFERTVLNIMNVKDRADIIIDNNGTRQTFYQQLLKIFKIV